VLSPERVDHLRLKGNTRTVHDKVDGEWRSYDANP